MRRALVLGGTGLVGSAVLRALLDDDHWDEVVSLGRRTPTSSGSRLRVVLRELDELESAAEWFAADAVFCCLGTTLRQAGSREAFRRVDHDYCVAAARLAAEQGARCFLMVSALNANPEGLSFYARVKGQAEQEVGEVGPAAVVFMQPSLLQGERGRRRRGEEFGQKAYDLVRPLVDWTHADWLPVPGDKVALAMVDIAREPDLKGMHRLRRRDILARARRYQSRRDAS